MEKKKKLLKKNKPGLVLIIDLILVLLILFFLPPVGYYSQIQVVFQKPEVFGTEISLPSVSPIAKNPLNIPPPIITAKSVIVMDVASGMILYQNNAAQSLPQASTTKIMTAMVTLETYPLDQILLVPKNFRDGQTIKLPMNEKISVENLLYALLVASANDAAEVLAANYPAGREAFVMQMNQKAQQLNLTNTHFVNPTGIDEPGQYSSSLDLARLAVVAIQNPVFSKMVATKDITISNADNIITYQLTNVNLLLGKNEWTKGIKTGWTDQAGECLVGLAEKDGRQIITVILGSQDRFGETENLENWVFNNFVWEMPE
ncbi:hypothetical protein COT44_00235 [Candidatus Shapirobacteria bacterium CG08_land_8_20_14_0_20_39_18]|uniref:Peptidase S11 D-alanyl-D-alanine carboxypeptidase A N-terminal domain-containing protein n=1 Tax=Candidatus Shapirobacteria bacterium CG08_land_8_20_14_0_20_39_18 TaxID=1974883 RepID=A0A2M6XE61_9BACT|nr:MAG: hypothetical protein COT44_00235 [Candidatus Shapirobacteria bacterium CG08_land_8_20_14_0_20_39_18]PIY64696.1 MAG: hypothetical protein COY91_04475 [Candidatus Shapirobacteria bacterium CG_4_10_14_0_8_um_filter_39_15]PJE68763.1 MAG: hypothetical protein COU94_00390 [Candidatus Shapirobacteria bacterium CG10_big_fil_rev_8_21_14_0_10_38_8]